MKVANDMTTVYIGAYTAGSQLHEKGIYRCEFDESTGSLSLLGVEESGPSPSFLTLSRDLKNVFAVNELDGGTVRALDRDVSTGGLSALNAQLTHGASPCYVSFDPSGTFLLVANYTGGTIAVFPIGVDSQLSPSSCVIDHAKATLRPRRDATPHPHMIAPTPDGAYIMVTDLGLDATLLYRLSDGILTLDDGATALAKVGAGPRHFAFSPDGRTAYVINELDSTLDVFAYAGGRLRRRQTISSLPEDFSGTNSTAQVLVSPDGRFIYGSNRGHDSIAIWPVDQSAGAVCAPTWTPSGGQTPRNFAIDPSGRWLITANQDSNSVFVFASDAETGQLTNTGQELAIQAPVCIVFAA